MPATGNIKKGDRVKVVAGKKKNKGQIGVVLSVDRDKQRVIVEKLNMVKRHQKAGQGTKQGGIIEKEAPIHISNVMVMCGSCLKATRVKKHILDDGKKVRACAKCGEQIDT